MSALVFKIDTLKDARRAIDVYSQTGCTHRIPLVEAVITGRIAHWEVHRSGSIGQLKRFMALASGRPTLILVGDDDDEPTGPAGWKAAQRLLRWARVVVLHGTGGERWHYEVTVNTAVVCGRVLMVECSTATLSLWMAATRRWAPDAGVQIIRVPEGAPPHPVAEAAEFVQ